MLDPTIREKIDAHIEANLEQSLARLSRLVSQPSVAAQNLGIGECAELVAEMLDGQGHQTAIMPTGGSPVVFGESKGAVDKTLLFYLHYDVQPAEPFDLWDSPPFEMTRRGDKYYGRGISDDKGHIAARLAAVDAVVHAVGELPVNLKFVIEGEEEIGSVHLADFISANKDLLAADACVWEFGGVNEFDVPVQYLGMRGICYVELRVKTARYDAHSGLAGSIFHNAAWRLVWALNTLKDQDERILIPGHYDSVRPPTERDLELLAAMPDTAPAMIDHYELSGFLKGMEGGPELRRAEVFEPTCTICGLTSGYQEAGSKTVLPAEASAKVDFRLVPDQTPGEVLGNLRKHLDANGFEDIEITYLGGNPGARTDPDHPFIQMSNEMAKLAYGVDPVVSPMVGGSGPNYPFTQELGVPISMAGISYPENQVHAPNEHIRLDLFEKGIKHTAYILAGFADL